MRSDLHKAFTRLTPDPLSAIRDACAFVAEHAECVRVVEGALPGYARALVDTDMPGADVLALPSAGRANASTELERRAAFVLMLDTVNFGSGYWPHLRKRPGHSGYRTIEARLLDLFEREGPPPAAELAESTPERCAEIFGQVLAPPIDELMQHFADAWRELGEWVASRYAGSYVSLVAAADGEAQRLIELLLELPMFRDISSYRGRPIPLLKRAQIAVADLADALPAPLGSFRGLERLTLFADNLIPHVLRIDGVLAFDSTLLERIQREQLIAAGSLEEVEMRACAVHAVELLSAELSNQGSPRSPRELDRWLWQRGAARAYKAEPRPRARSIYY